MVPANPHRLFCCARELVFLTALGSGGLSIGDEKVECLRSTVTQRSEGGMRESGYDFQQAWTADDFPRLIVVTLRHRVRNPVGTPS